VIYHYPKPDSRQRAKIVRPSIATAVESTLVFRSNKLSRQLMSPSMLQRIASGDSAAVRDCMQEYGPLVWSIARRLSRTPADAEDATQEIFLDIWRSAARFDASQGSDKVFIAMIARRRLIDRLRKTSAEPPMDPVEALDAVAWADPGTASETSIEAEHAARALAELRPEQRQVLELGLLHGLSQSEIATRLSMPLGTVKSFMRRGLIKVRELMNIDAEGVSASI
jgi:RNA polymerase sigma-70 factor (ECF subfamily)